jgi:transcriptional regulator with XRE-family HTH domain
MVDDRSVITSRKVNGVTGRSEREEGPVARPGIRPQPITQGQLRSELPRLLRERGLSLRALAAEVGVNESHLSRALRGAQGKKITGQLAGEIAVALALPRDYFPEYRQSIVSEAVVKDAELRERIYGELRSASRRRH